MLPLRFTFASDSIKSDEKSQDNSPIVEKENVNSPNVALVNMCSPKVAPLDSWSQRYSIPICLMLTAVAGFISGYNVGRYRSKFS